MDHEGEGKTTDVGRDYPCNPRRVKFKCKADNVKDFNEHIDENRQCLINDERISEKKQQSPAYMMSCGEKLNDFITTESSNVLVGILRPRSISLSPLPLPSVPPTTPRFTLSKLSKAMNRSIETMGCIENLKKRIFHAPKHEKLQPTVAELSCSSLKQSNENGKMKCSFGARQKRRTMSVENTKIMMGQSLPPTMMPYIEETLKATYFVRRRRKENGYGRIIHKILIEHHKQFQKKLRDGDTNPSSRHKL